MLEILDGFFFIMSSDAWTGIQSPRFAGWTLNFELE